MRSLRSLELDLVNLKTHQHVFFFLPQSPIIPNYVLFVELQLVQLVSQAIQSSS